jgi:hypothetical protein
MDSTAMSANQVGAIDNRERSDSRLASPSDDDPLEQAYRLVPGLPSPLPASGWAASLAKSTNINTKY